MISECALCAFQPPNHCVKSALVEDGLFSDANVCDACYARMQQIDLNTASAAMIEEVDFRMESTILSPSRDDLMRYLLLREQRGWNPPTDHEDAFIARYGVERLTAKEAVYFFGEQVAHIDADTFFTSLMLALKNGDGPLDARRFHLQ